MDRDELQHRIKNAIILLSDGHPFRVGDLKFSCKDKDHFSVLGWTLTNDIDTLTKQSALKELNEIKTLFSKMLVASNELGEFLKGRQIEYLLGYGYGMGAIGICKEAGGNITWEADFKE